MLVERRDGTGKCTSILLCPILEVIQGCLGPFTHQRVVGSSSITSVRVWSPGGQCGDGGEEEEGETGPVVWHS